ncbi:MAG: hypothetical protein LC792_00610, partial [Actinobacteria bacterium]|nr:hypothetical protein [Actinomycetota bacterium]
EQDGRWRVAVDAADVPTPESVRDVVGRRLSRLSEEANRVLACAAVIGLEFEPAVVGAAGDFSEEAVVAALEEAMRARLVVEVAGAVPRNRFGHALVRDTLYDELTAARRTLLHRRVAEAIETVHARRIDDHLPALAHHWARASAPAARTDRAVDYAVRAGDQALAQVAHSEAAGWYRSALELLDASDGPVDEGRRLELLLALGDAERRAGEPVYRETLLDAARLAQARGDVAALAQAALGNNRGLVWGASGFVDRERVAALEAALDAVGDRDDAIRARLLSALTCETVWDGDDELRLRQHHEAVQLARRHGDPAILATVLASRGYALSGPEAVRLRAEAADELEALAQQVDDPVIRAWTYMMVGRSALETARWDDARRTIDEAGRLAVAAGQPSLRWFHAFNAMGFAVAACDGPAAERRGRDVVEFGTSTGTIEAVAVYSMSRFLLLLGNGGPGEIESGVRQMIIDVPGLGLGPAILAWLCGEVGQYEEARDLLADGDRRFFRPRPHNQLWLSANVAWAAAAAILGDRVRAAVLAELIAPFPEHIVVGGGVIFGSLAHTRGLLASTMGDTEGADEHFAVALAQHDRLTAPALSTRTRVEWARTLLRRAGPGDAAKASDLLGQALAITTQHGLTRLESKAQALLAEA